jgi:hypothetical protein
VRTECRIAENGDLGWGWVGEVTVIWPREVASGEESDPLLPGSVTPDVAEDPTSSTGLATEARLDFGSTEDARRIRSIGPPPQWPEALQKAEG